MQQVKVLIVEDDWLIAESLKVIIEGMGYQVPAIFDSGLEVLKAFRPDFADIVIMDIHLAGPINGVDTSVELKKISPVPVIFVTNNINDAVRKKAIYETNAVYYLSKPFAGSDIRTAIDLALKSLKSDSLAVRHPYEASYLLSNSIFVKDGSGFKKVPLHDVLFLKADGGYCQFVMRDTSILFSENLSYMEEKLGFARELLRVHRSYIVNINYIQRIHDNRLWIDEIEIPIGKTYRESTKDRFRFL